MLSSLRQFSVIVWINDSLALHWSRLITEDCSVLCSGFRNLIVIWSSILPIPGMFFFMNIEVTTFWFTHEKVSSKPHSSLSYWLYSWPWMDGMSAAERQCLSQIIHQQSAQDCQWWLKSGPDSWFGSSWRRGWKKTKTDMMKRRYYKTEEKHKVDMRKNCIMFITWMQK